jgi:hypothetical protein
VWPVAFAGWHQSSMLDRICSSARLVSTLAQSANKATATIRITHRSMPSRFDGPEIGLGHDFKTLWKSVGADFPKPFSKLLKLLACGPSPGPTNISKRNSFTEGVIYVDRPKNRPRLNFGFVLSCSRGSTTLRIWGSGARIYSVAPVPAEY